MNLPLWHEILVHPATVTLDERRLWNIVVFKGHLKTSRLHDLALVNDLNNEIKEN